MEPSQPLFSPASVPLPSHTCACTCIQAVCNIHTHTCAHRFDKRFIDLMFDFHDPLFVKLRTALEYVNSNKVGSWVWRGGLFSHSLRLTCSSWQHLSAHFCAPQKGVCILRPRRTNSHVHHVPLVTQKNIRHVMFAWKEACLMYSVPRCFLSSINRCGEWTLLPALSVSSCFCLCSL